METLRSIVESMEHTGEGDYFVPPQHDPTKCPKCLAIALLEEAETVDLVKKLRLRAEAGRAAAQDIEKSVGNPPKKIQAAILQAVQEIAIEADRDAAELAVWLPLHDAKMRTEARLDAYRNVRESLEGAGDAPIPEGVCSNEDQEEGYADGVLCTLNMIWKNLRMLEKVEQAARPDAEKL